MQHYPFFLNWSAKYGYLANSPLVKQIVFKVIERATDAIRPLSLDETCKLSQ
jgi:hypothetical protein